MKKIIVIMSLLCLFVSNGQTIHAEEYFSLNEDEYNTVLEGEEWGSAYTKLIFKKTEKDTLVPTDYLVSATQSIQGEVVAEELAFVEEVYESNEAGDEGEGYITLVIQKHPMLTTFSSYLFDMDSFMNLPAQVEFTIESKNYDRVINKKVLEYSDTDVFEIGESIYENEWGETLSMKYASYEPIEDHHKNGLIVWLHGMGEGGEDPYLPLLGNDVTNFASQEYQEFFDGAYVLVPQAPTFWLDANGESMTRDGSSIYEDQLMALIDEYVNSHEDIDKDRIYIGGCSNGGFMTMRMIIKNPNYFAAAFPICEAYKDRWITVDQIKAIRHIPIWFTQAKEDSLVNPNETTIPTYKRLLKEGANVHFTYLEDVTDPTGQYFYPDGVTPYTYDTHFSWVYTLANKVSTEFDGTPVQVNGKDVTIMEWLALQTKQESQYEAPTFFENYGILVGCVIFCIVVILLLINPRGEKV